MTQYILRLDDICPTMRPAPFAAVIAACRAAGVTGIIGVVPDNRDPALAPAPSDPHFWTHLRELAAEGWIVAQHGYQHVYATADAGLLRLRRRSEFAGLPYEVQYRTIVAGKRILETHLERRVTWWMAPAHSFDATTCRALVAAGFTHVSDGIALYPYVQHQLTWVPHQLWRARAQPFGVWTVGLHLNTITPAQFTATLQFITQHRTAMHTRNLVPRRHVLNPAFRLYWYAKFLTLKRFA